MLRGLVAAPLRPVHTFSIVARDPVTGDMGVAVQSHWFAVGAEVTWGEAGVGVVATQSFVDPGYGPRGLALMRSGKTANEALRGLLAADDFADVRQVAMVDAEGMWPRTPERSALRLPGIRWARIIRRKRISWQCERMAGDGQSV